MVRTTRPRRVLALGLSASVLAALVPAGLRDAPIPAWSHAIWAAMTLGSVLVMRRADGGFGAAARRLLWLLPPVLLLTVPASLLAEPGRRAEVALALVLRSIAAATAALATVTSLGPPGLIAGLRALRVPGPLVEVLHAMLVALAAIARQVAGMQRARAARRARSEPWSSLARAPAETLLGFGRIAGALFLRSMERAFALERARHARGGGEG